MSKETILVVEDETLVGLELKEDLERLSADQIGAYMADLGRTTRP